MSQKMRRAADGAHRKRLLRHGHPARRREGRSAFRRGTVHKRQKRQRGGVLFRLHHALHVLSELRDISQKQGHDSQREAARGMLQNARGERRSQHKPRDSRSLCRSGRREPAHLPPEYPCNIQLLGLHLARDTHPDEWSGGRVSARLQIQRQQAREKALAHSRLRRYGSRLDSGDALSGRQAEIRQRRHDTKGRYSAPPDTPCPHQTEH